MAFAALRSENSIWLFAGLYFLCYAPFTGLTKALASGAYPGSGAGVAGATLLPVATVASLAVLIVFLAVSGWLRYASSRTIAGRELPVPTRWTALSGLCTSIILTTTTLAYTFEGVSIVFVMLLMRGGVLVLAPIIDTLTGRRARWFSWVALLLSLTSLWVAFAEVGGYRITLVSGVDIGLYLLAYFVRLQFMSRLAKSPDPDVTRRYFIEEQLMTTPVTMCTLVLLALWGRGEFMLQIRAGFTEFLSSGLVLPAALVGVGSQLVGIFGTLIFLDRRENTFSVPVNRCASVLAGVLASCVLALTLGAAWPSAYQLVGAGLLVSAILVLGFAPAFARARGGT